jgi:hypothetical protein
VHPRRRGTAFQSTFGMATGVGVFLSQPELGGNPVSLRAPNRPLSGSVAFLGHLGLSSVPVYSGTNFRPWSAVRWWWRCAPPFYMPFW